MFTIPTSSCSLTVRIPTTSTFFSADTLSFKVVSPVTLKSPSTLTFFSNVTSSLKETTRPKEISLSNTRLPPNIKFRLHQHFLEKLPFH